jgi:signal transduction histidine kinase
MAKFRRTVFVINPKFQYKVSFMLCFLATLVCSFYPVSIFEVFTQLNSKFPELISAQSRDNLLFWLITLQVAMTGLMFIACLFITHKIAGPLYKLKLYLSRVRSGEECGELKFRKNDYFHDIANEVSQTIEHLQAKRHNDFEYIDEVIAYISNLSLVIPEDKKPVLKEIITKLSDIRSKSL